MEAAEFLEKIEFYDFLKEEEKKLVSENVYLKEYTAGEMIHSCTGSCLGMIYVIKGSIRTSIVSKEGRELTLFKLSPGDTCVISAACVLHEIRLESYMEAETDTTVLILKSKALAGIIPNNAEVRSYCYEIATRRFASALFVLQEIILLRFDRRLAKYLLDIAAKSPDSKLRITQETIAKDVNSAREVVARMLKQFEIEGFVELGRGWIKIVDKEGLASIS